MVVDPARVTEVGHALYAEYAKYPGITATVRFLREELYIWIV
jgi:hypothetical protein